MQILRVASACLPLLLFVSNGTAGAQPADPLAEIFSGEVRPAVESLVAQFRDQRRYKAADFPLPPERFDQFKQEIVSEFVRALHLEDWVVRSAARSAARFEAAFETVS